LKESPKVSAVILNYKTPHETLSCVDALLAQTISEDIEIIVVDNYSKDDSMKILRSLLGQGKNIKLLETKRNLGFSGGNNLGSKEASGKYILIINPDTTLENDVVEKMFLFLEENNEVGIIGPQLVFPNGTIRDSYRTFPTMLDIIIKRTPLSIFFPRRMRDYLQWDKSPYEKREVDWLVGACMFMKKDLFEGIGKFDERFFLFFEDTDLCRKCHLNGKKVVYFPDAKGHDNQNRLSSGGMLSFLWKNTVRIHILSAIKYFWKWRKILAAKASLQ
jgi:N-acetylglucosaminyl-diphospho-decaprenol L-rhamnosyltransferase